MLPTALIHEIDHLLKEGALSHRKIAIRLGVSRGTISAIANGRRGLHGKEADDVRRVRVHTSPPARCPRCGYRVYLPCLICEARTHSELQLIVRRKERDRKLHQRRLNNQIEANDGDFNMTRNVREHPTIRSPHSTSVNSKRIHGK